MITLTPQAAKQVRLSAEQSNLEGEWVLRLAAKQNPDGSMEYGMGFDEAKEDDLVFKSEKVEIAISGQYGPLLKGTTIDFDEVDGQMAFIFLNPNDANYTPPGSAPEGAAGGCGGGGCGGSCGS